MDLARRLPRAALAACLAVSLALLVAPLHGHVDDTDAQLYQVLSRQMARSRSWLEPGPPPGSASPFREHLPFGFWPSVAVVRLFGERALPLPPIASCLGTVALVLLLGARLVSLRAGIAAALLLGCTETFFLYGARPRLDPLLLLLATLAAAPALLGRMREGRGFAAAAGAGALAALVKGPFGLVPLAAAGAARAIFDSGAKARSGPAMPKAGAGGRASGLAVAGAALALAALPAALLLAFDHGHGGTWWRGYAEGQLLSSARGLRPDGESGLLYPFASIAGRFWPGLPLVVLGALQALPLPLPPALRPRAEARAPLRLFALASALGAAALCLPARKVWNHELVLYPLLALVAGAAADPLLRGISPRAARWALGSLAGAAGALSAAGFGARLLQPPCVGSREFAARLSQLEPGAPVLVVSPIPDWHTLASLAAERGLSPWPLRALPPGPASPEAPGDPASPGARALEPFRARLALASEEAGPAPLPWRIEGRARGWLLLSR